MSVIGQTGVLVELAFPVYDVDGETLVSGLVDADFSKFLLLDNTVSSVVVTVSEVSSGRYVASFTPNQEGLWFVHVDTPYSDSFACYVQVYDDPSASVGAIVSGVWSEALPGAYPAGSAGEQLASARSRIDALDSALVLARLTVSSGATDTVVPTNATKPDGYYDGMTVVLIDGTESISRRVSSYATGSFTLDPPAPFTPSNGSSLVVLGILGEVAISSGSISGKMLEEIHRLMGLDKETPVCISTGGQEAGDIRLVHSVVGDRLIVTRE